MERSATMGTRLSQILVSVSSVLWKGAKSRKDIVRQCTAQKNENHCPAGGPMSSRCADANGSVEGDEGEDMCCVWM